MAEKSTNPLAGMENEPMMEAHINKGEQAFKMMADILRLGRVIYQTLHNGRIPRGEALLRIEGRQYRLSVGRNPTAVTITLSTPPPKS
jgi:hypothetical protein